MLSALKWAALAGLTAFLALFVPAASSQGLNTDLSDGESFTFFDIGKNLPRFTFKIVPNKQPNDQYGNAQSTIRDIEVYRGDSKVLWQHLTGCDLEGMGPPPSTSESGPWFYTNDYNFDGYQDIFLMTGWGATGNFSGCIWLYNPQTGRFVYSKEFSDLGGITDVDASTHTLFTTKNSSAVASETERYAVKNNRPVLIWSEALSADPTPQGFQNFHCEIQERRNGRMVAVLDVDSECPASAPSP